jgi:Transposase
MNVMIGIDPHKASHTAVAIGKDEGQLSSFKVRAIARQVDQLMSWAEPFEKRTWAIESAGGLGYLLSQQLVARGEDVLDVPATLASRIRVLATGRSNKNDPVATPTRSPLPPCEHRSFGSSSGPTIVKSCASWPNATWILAAIAPGSSVASMPSWPSSHRVELPRK